MAGVMTEQSREVWQSSKRLFFEVLICRGDTTTEAVIFSINCAFDVFYQHTGKLQSRLTTELGSSRGARKFPRPRSELTRTKAAASLQAVTFPLCFRNPNWQTAKFSFDAFSWPLSCYTQIMWEIIHEENNWDDFTDVIQTHCITAQMTLHQICVHHIGWTHFLSQEDAFKTSKWPWSAGTTVDKTLCCGSSQQSETDW